MNIYQNYDFGKHWTKVYQFIKTDEGQKIIATAFRHWNNGQKITNPLFKGKRFNKNEPPASLMSYGDGYMTLCDALVDNVIDNRRMDILTDDDIKNLDTIQMINYDDEDDDVIDKSNDLLYKIRDKVEDKLGYNYKTNKDKLAFYIPWGSCHTWNRYFGLWLARKVCPDRDWIVQTSDKHTTVYCKETNEIFDIIYWGIDKRLEYHCFDKQYSSTDLSLGGNDAFKDTIN